MMTHLDWLFKCLIVLMLLSSRRWTQPCRSNGAIAPAPAESVVLDEEWKSSFYADRYERSFVDGQEINLRLSFLPKTLKSGIRLAIFTKPLNDGDWSSPFDSQYTADIPSSDTEIHVKAQGRTSSPLLWKIEINERLNLELANSPTSMTVGIRVSSLPVSSTIVSGAPGLSRMLGVIPELVCESRARIRYQENSTATMEFANRSVLDVQIQDTEHLMTAGTMQQFGLYIVQSLGTWNAACFNCATNNLLLIRVGQDIYLNSIIASAYRQAASANLSPEYMADLDMTVALMRRNASASGIQFERLSAGDPAAAAICGDVKGWHDPYLKAIRFELGCPRKDDAVLAEDVSAVHVVLGKRLPGDCDPKMKLDPSVIACGGESGVELNTEDFGFVAHNSEQSLFGSGGVSVDLLKVLIHEVGHWIGLPHLQGHSIMTANFSDIDCIDDDAVNKLLTTSSKQMTNARFALRYEQ